MERKLRMFMGNRNLRIVYLFLFTFFVSVPSLLAQSRVISGTVKSGDDNTALPGASVIIKGTTEGTTTDADGNFKVTASSSDVLVISSIGYARLEVPVNDQTVINVTLAADVASLQEVVVIGYGTQERKDVSGAISSISASQIEKIPVTTLDQSLQGRSAGVQVTSNDASPGAGITVQIRGIGSFGDTGPLYVVDGYPIAGSINTLNPNDIASMEILKDASATAIYGSRAANGVVIITTKRGKNDGVQISFDAFGSVQAQPKSYKVLDAATFATFAKEVIADTDPGYAVIPEWNDPSKLRNIDWQKTMYQVGGKQSYNLSIRGGTDKVQSSFSLGYLRQTGVIKFSDFARYNAALNLDYNPVKWLKTSVNVKYNRNEGAVRFGSGPGGVGQLTRLIPTMTGNPVTDQVVDANGNFGYYTLKGSATSSSTNVYADAAQQDPKNQTNNLLASTFIELTLAKGLRVKSNFGINTTDYSGYFFTPSNKRTDPPAQSNYNQTARNTFEWLWENTVAYSRTFGDHNIDFVAGVSAQKNTMRQLYVAGSNQVSDGTRSLTGLTITNYYGNTTIWSLASEFGRLTYKFKDRYILTGTVRRDGSSRFRPGGVQYGVFPSVAAAWKIKEEPFMAGVTFFSDLKLRGSWGQTGNQNVTPFQYTGLYATQTSATLNNGYPFGATKTLLTGLAPTILPAPNLTWETTTQTDVGIDASFLNGSVTLTADYYRRVSSNFLFDLPVPSQTGFQHAVNNFGSIENKGLELALGYRKSSGDFQWGVTANVTTVHNKILELSPNTESISNFSTLNFPNYGAASWTVFSKSQVGGEVGAFYGFKSAGIFQNQSEIDLVNAQAAAQNVPGTFYQSSTTSPGDRKFVDVNGDGKVTDDDRVIIGSPIPKFYGGVNVDATYKNFDFSMFWYVTYGNKILNYQKRNLESIATNGGVGLENVSVSFYQNRWTETNHSSTTPRAVRSDVSGNTRISDAYVEDGSYVRLRNVQLGYTLPSAIISKWKITKLRFYVSAQNLFTITKYSGLDPEIGQVTDPSVGVGTANPNVSQRSVTASGIDLGNFPTSRSYTLGLNLQF